MMTKSQIKSVFLKNRASVHCSLEKAPFFITNERALVYSEKEASVVNRLAEVVGVDVFQGLHKGLVTVTMGSPGPLSFGVDNIKQVVPKQALRDVSKMKEKIDTGLLFMSGDYLVRIYVHQDKEGLLVYTSIADRYVNIAELLGFMGAPLFSEDSSDVNVFSKEDSLYVVRGIVIEEGDRRFKYFKKEGVGE